MIYIVIGSCLFRDLRSPLNRAFYLLTCLQRERKFNYLLRFGTFRLLIYSTDSTDSKSLTALAIVVVAFTLLSAAAPNATYLQLR